VVVAVVVVAVLASIVVEVVKRKGITTEDKDKAKKAVTWLLVVFTTLFSWLAYVIFFLQTNLSVLQQLPVVGSHAVEALGVAFTLYNLRLSKWYKGFAAWAGTVGKKKDLTGLQSLPELTPQDSDL
jgi:cytochrome c biogenesis protein CcdA